MTEQFILEPDEGKAIWYLGGIATHKITNEQTLSGWGLSVETFPGGFTSALHNHPTEESGFYILRGKMRVRIGDMEGVAGPGAFIYLPANVAHAFKVESDEACTWINVQGPTGDFRRLSEEIGTDAIAGEPPPAITPEQLAKAAGAGSRHNLERLGPSPFA